MISDKERVLRVFTEGKADYIKCDKESCYIVNKDESYKRYIHQRTFDALRDSLSLSHSRGTIKYYKLIG